MSQNPLRKSVPGDALPLSVRTQRHAADAARDTIRRTFGARGIQTPGAFSKTAQTGIILVENNTGVDQDFLAVYGVDEPIILPSENADTFKSEATIKGVIPTINEHLGKFVVALEPIANGLVGRAVVSGVTIAIVNVLDVGHTFAEVRDGETSTLESATSGAAVILWRESGTGEKLAIVRIGAGGTDIPIPEFVHMFLGAVGANTLGGEFATYHPLILP